MVCSRKLVWLLLVLIVPSTADAQFGIPRRACHKCKAKRHAIVPYLAPPVIARCPQMIPQPILPAPVCPQVQTTYRREQYTTYQPVTKTQIRREAVQVNVPVTTQRQVTVDEGGYKMVWVPKLTTKSVAETTIQKQVQYRDVPYQVVENVPQVHTRLVPQQTVAYQPARVAMVKPCCQSNAFVTNPIPMLSTIPQANVEHFQRPTVPNPQRSVEQKAEDWVKVPQKDSALKKVESQDEIQLQKFERVSSVRSIRGMFSRPNSNSTALRTSRIY